MIDFLLMDLNSIDTTKAKCFEGSSIGFIYDVGIEPMKIVRGITFALLWWLLEHKKTTNKHTSKNGQSLL